MKIAGLYINGFGIFKDVRIDGLSPGLNIFTGSNESGKSTLLGFIRSVLFGFPDGRSNENSYPPLAGGRHGGNIALSIDGDTYIVERQPGPRGGNVEVLRPDNTRAGKELLDRLIPVSDRSLFNNIYAFSLSELQTFDTLSTESVEEALYSAGAGINLNALASLRSIIDKKEADLFKPKGNKGEINIILARLAAIANEKKTLMSCVKEYDGIVFQISDQDKKIESLGKRKTDLSSQLKKIEMQIAILPEWISLVLAGQKLESLPVVNAFPSQGINRFEGLKDKLDDLVKQQQEKKDEIRQREETLNSLLIDEKLLQQSSEIRRIERESVHFESVEKDIADTAQELTAGERKLKEGLNRLGSSWSEQMLTGFDLSIARHEQVRTYRDRLARARLNEQRKKERLTNTRSDLEEADKQVKEIKEPAIKDQEHLKALRQSCVNIQKLETEKNMLNGELQHNLDRLDDISEENNALDSFCGTDDRGSAFNRVIYILPAALFIASLYGFLSGRDWSISGLSAAVLIFIIIWALRSKVQKEAGRRAEEGKTRSDKIGLKTADLKSRISVLEKKIAENEECISNEKLLLNKGNISGHADFAEAEQQISEQIELLKSRQEALKAIETARKRFEESRIEHERAEKEDQSLQGEWKEWLSACNLEITLSPEGVIEILTLIGSLREQFENLERLRARISGLKNKSFEYTQFVRKTLTSCEREMPENIDIRILIHNIIQDLKVQEQAAQKRDILGKEIESIRETFNRLEKQALKIREEITELIEAGGAGEEEDFRNRGEIFEKRLELEKEIEQCKDNIKRLAREPEKLDHIIEDISKVEAEELEEKKAQIEKDLENVENQFNVLTKEQAALEERARQMIHDSRISELRTEEEELKGKLSSLSEEWITARLARVLIGKTRERYEKERQPEVLSGGASFFSRMTLGKYRSIISPIGENRIEVIDRNNNPRTIDVLSRGTAEQLYLALRFGFIREFSRNSSALPVIMDDILVNFDPKRAKETIRGIMELSLKHQLLFFTCHPYITEMFREEEPNIPVYTIAGGEIK